jgi:hypothetical protein
MDDFKIAHSAVLNSEVKGTRGQDVMNMKTKAKKAKTAKAAKFNGAVKLNGKVQALKPPRTKAEAEAQIRDLIKENKKALHALAKL